MDINELISIVTLNQIEDNKFEGQNYKTVWGRIFGGQVLSQSLHAAYKTVPEDPLEQSYMQHVVTDLKLALQIFSPILFYNFDPQIYCLQFD